MGSMVECGIPWVTKACQCVTSSLWQATKIGDIFPSNVGLCYNVFKTLQSLSTLHSFLKRPVKRFSKV